MTKEEQQAWEAWEQHCAEVFNSTEVKDRETDEQKEKRIARLKRNYAEFFYYYLPAFATSECADFHIEAANKIKNNKDIFAVLEWPREHAKSVHADVGIPLFLKANNELTGVIIVSKSEDAAKKLLGDLQAQLEKNQRYIADYGEQKSVGSWIEGSFISQDNVLFQAYGRGQSPRGLRNDEKRPNYCVVDDIDDDEIVHNQERVEKVVNWVLEALINSLSLLGSRMVIVGNRIHPKSILAHLVGDIDPKTPKREGIYHSKVMATIDGTFTGKPSWWQRYTSEILQKRFKVIGYYSTMKEFFHKPVTKGKVFKPEWIQWGKIPKLSDMDMIVAYLDPSYKPKTTSDFKSWSIWGKKGLYLYLIDRYCAQATITEAIKWIYDYHEKLPQDVIVNYYMEEVFLQDMFYDDFDLEAQERNYALPIAGDTRKKPDKYARIEATAPYYERGYVIYNEKKKESHHMQTGLDMVLGFQKGSSIHDDAPDSDEGAIWILNNASRQESFTPQLGERKHKSRY
jgi:hypothetical protein